MSNTNNPKEVSAWVPSTLLTGGTKYRNIATWRNWSIDWQLAAIEDLRKTNRIKILLLIDEYMIWLHLLDGFTFLMKSCIPMPIAEHWDHMLQLEDVGGHEKDTLHGFKKIVCKTTKEKEWAMYQQISYWLWFCVSFLLQKQAPG